MSHWLAPPGAPKWALPREAERKGALLPDAGVAGGVAAGVAKGVAAQAKGEVIIIQMWSGSCLGQTALAREYHGGHA